MYQLSEAVVPGRQCPCGSSNTGLDAAVELSVDVINIYTSSTLSKADHPPQCREASSNQG